MLVQGLKGVTHLQGLEGVTDPHGLEVRVIMLQELEGGVSNPSWENYLMTSFSLSLV